MRIITTIDETRQILDAARARGESIGLVPTMGFLHDGHASLMRRSVADNDLTLVTNFVNPTQFAPDEDLSAYPRDMERDTGVCEGAGVDFMLVPTTEEMYPLWPSLTTVTVAEISEHMEGSQRPTHFSGVATVVSKLLNIGGRCRAYFGEKDYQQLALIRRMVIDLSFPVEVVGCPIVREDNGLAMSSRNVYLTPAEREAASVLRRSLLHAQTLIEGGESDAAEVTAQMLAMFDAEPLVDRPDYIQIVDAETLEDRNPVSGGVRVILAAQCGKPRLLDNIGATAPAPR